MLDVCFLKQVISHALHPPKKRGEKKREKKNNWKAEEQPWRQSSKRNNFHKGYWTPACPQRDLLCYNLRHKPITFDLIPTCTWLLHWQLRPCFHPRDEGATCFLALWQPRDGSASFPLHLPSCSSGRAEQQKASARACAEVSPHPKWEVKTHPKILLHPPSTQESSCAAQSWLCCWLHTNHFPPTFHLFVLFNSPSSQGPGTKGDLPGRQNLPPPTPSICQGFEQLNRPINSAPAHHSPVL